MPESPSASIPEESSLPGEPLPSGFDYRPASEVPEAGLSEEAQARVLKKMASVDEARLKAAEEGRTSHVG
jgi:hypothetical protein